MTDRMERQFRFALEADKEKRIGRQTYLSNGAEKENDAEHAWHLAMLAIVLKEYANEPVDLATVLETVLIHDVVEIDAGDTYAYDEAGNATKAEREQKAAERLYGILPKDQGERLKKLWEEFEAQSTPEARFANALDRIQPLMLNYNKQGEAWCSHGTRKEQVMGRMQPVFDGSEALGSFAVSMIEQAAQNGWLK